MVTKSTQQLSHIIRIHPSVNKQNHRNDCLSRSLIHNPSVPCFHPSVSACRVGYNTLMAGIQTNYIPVPELFARGVSAALSAVLDSNQISVSDVPLQTPQLKSHGDVSTSVAMTLISRPEVKHHFSNPREFAQAIVAQLPKTSAEFPFTQFEVAGPGFINAHYSWSEIIPFVQTHFQNPAQLPRSAKIGSSYIIEYMQPNTNKPLHIGHLRNAALGASLIALLRAENARVAAATVNNDRGLHITKSMWAYLVFGTKQNQDLVQNSWKEVITQWHTNPNAWQEPQDASEERLHKPDHFVGYWYSRADEFVENTEIEQVWSEMLQAWEDTSNPLHGEVRSLWQRLNDWFYQGYAESAAVFGFAFDEGHVSYESELYQRGKTTVLEGAKSGVFSTIEGGAVKVDLSSYNLPDKVLLRSDGTGIYMTFDIELTRQRYQENAESLVWVVGNDQELYFKQLFAVCEMLGYGTREQFTHFAYGMVRLPEGKMSSRKGRVVYADDLLEQAVSRAHEILHETGADKRLSTEEQHAIAQAVGVGAVKWTMVSQDPLSELTFDVTSSVSFKGYSGPYIQYTYARAQSVLGGITKDDYETYGDSNKQFDLVINEEEKDVLRNILRYYDVFEQAAVEWAPHRITQYLHELAQSFNTFYNSHQILKADSSETRAMRIQLTQITAGILKQGLTVLGIKALEKM